MICVVIASAGIIYISNSIVSAHDTSYQGISHTNLFITIADTDMGIPKGGYPYFVMSTEPYRYEVNSRDVNIYVYAKSHINQKVNISYIDFDDHGYKTREIVDIGPVI